MKRKRSDKRKRVLTIAVGVIVLLIAALVTVALTAKGNEKSTLADVSAEECFNGDVNDLTTVDCTERHQSQLVAVVAAPDPSIAYPAGTIETDAQAACTTQFETFYGAPASTAVTNGLDLRAIAPTEQQWTDGETDSFCVVIAAGGADLQGSMKGKGAG